MQVVEGDILQQNSGLIVHGCNAQGVFNSGVAAQIRAKYPVVYDQYKNLQTGEGSLGICQIVKVTETMFIGNCITQLYFGKDGKRYADIRSIRKSLDSAMFWCDLMKQPLYMPEIGCGLGGLHWDEVATVIKDLEQKYPNVSVTLFRFKP